MGILKDRSYLTLNVSKLYLMAINVTMTVRFIVLFFDREMLIGAAFFPLVEIVLFPNVLKFSVNDFYVSS